jgi:4-amino-4-deoxy-L-arabinose transferase-like glycosyltransferase
MIDKRFNYYLALLFLLNAIQSMFMGLAHDEAYYWIYTESFKFGHFDHPPMVGWLIKLGTSMWGHSEFGLRFFFNVMQVLTLKMLWDMTNKKDSRLFFILALSFPLVVASGFLALPDTPLMFFAVSFLYVVRKYLEDDSMKHAWKIAIIIPLLFYSKYHGLVVVLFTLAAYPAFLKRKSFWFIVFSTLILFLPHVFWQFQNDFVTFKYHLFKRKQHHFKISNIFNYLGGQVFLAGILSAPFVFYSLGKLKKGSFERVLKYNIWGLFGLLLFSALRNKIEANWTITNFSFLVLVVYWVMNEHKWRDRLKYSASFMLVVMMIFRIYMIFPGKQPAVKRMYEFINWKNITSHIRKIADDEQLIANNYQIAGKLSFYSGKVVPAVHYKTRSSEFEMINDKYLPKEDVKITYISYFELPGSVKINIGYPEDIYVKKGISLKEVKTLLGINK